MKGRMSGSALKERRPMQLTFFATQRNVIIRPLFGRSDAIDSFSLPR